MDSDNEIDLSILKKYDQTCINVLDKSPSVHLYTFNKSLTAWDKSDIGGVFFVCKHSKSPHYSFLILNRKNPKTNVNEPITPYIQLQICSPFILYKNVNGGIFSIWFFSTEDCSRIGSLLNRLKGNEAVGVCDTSLLSSCLSVTAKPHQTDPALVANAHVSPPAIALDNDSVSHSFSKLVSLVRQSKEISQVAYSLTHAAKQPYIDDQQHQNSPSDSESVNRNTIIDMLSSAEADFKLSSQNNCHKSDVKPLKKSQCQGAIDLRMIENFSDVDHSRGDIPEKCQFYVSDLEQGLLQSEKIIVPPKPAKLLQEMSTRESTQIPCLPKINGPNQTSIAAIQGKASQKTKSTHHSSKPFQLAANSTAGTTDGSPRKPNAGTRSSASQRAGEEQLLRFNATVFADTDTGYMEDNEEELDDNEDEEMQLPLPAHSPETFFTPAVLGLHHHVTPSRIASAEGLSKGQLKSALLHLIENDENFLTSIHNAYVASLNSQLRKH